MVTTRKSAKQRPRSRSRSAEASTVSVSRSAARSVRNAGKTRNTCLNQNTFLGTKIKYDDPSKNNEKIDPNLLLIPIGGITYCFELDEVKGIDNFSTINPYTGLEWSTDPEIMTRVQNLISNFRPKGKVKDLDEIVAPTAPTGTATTGSDPRYKNVDEQQAAIIKKLMKKIESDECQYIIPEHFIYNGARKLKQITDVLIANNVDIPQGDQLNSKYKILNTLINLTIPQKQLCAVLTNVFPSNERVDTEHGVIPLTDSIAFNYTTLRQAIQRGDYDAVNGAIVNGADVNEEVEGGGSLLTLACSYNQDEIVELLVNHGANVNYINGEKSPLIIAAQNNNYMLTRYLVGKGADANRQITALLYALELKHNHVAAVLLTSGANPNTEFYDGTSPLMIAALSGDLETVKTLFNYTPRYININKQLPSNGFTALMMAAEYGHDDIVKYLISKGADINLRTAEYLTALSVAVMYGHRKVVTTLAENRAVIDEYLLNFTQDKKMVKLLKSLLESQRFSKPKQFDFLFK